MDRRQEGEHNYQNQFSTGLFDCDEQSCWWSFWFVCIFPFGFFVCLMLLSIAFLSRCPCLLSSQTSHSFELDQSRGQNLLYIGLACLAFLSLALFHGLAVLALLAIFLFLAYRGASRRTKIRERLSIQGTFMEDFMLHICCPICTLSQEAREGLT